MAVPITSQKTSRLVLLALRNAMFEVPLPRDRSLLQPVLYRFIGLDWSSRAEILVNVQVALLPLDEYEEPASEAMNKEEVL
jgi:hypothetical protein